MIFLKTFLISLVLLSTCAAAGMAIDGKAGFEAVGTPGFLRISGEGAKVTGTAEIKKDKVSGTFEVKLDELTTGIETRDSHMKETYLETKKYPTAKFKLDPIKLVDGSTDFSGWLDLHGTKKSISGVAKIKKNGESYKVSTSFIIKISDFNIKDPGYLGITMAKDVTVQVDFEAK